ncbi:hypothetical protein [Solicola gregarius]|uniref:Uncharacterized protein n=1 Tax=Solicola gregarius TaxID=2908642 RepID=A0AA46YNA8_9ACTN|nr:hypothetical protein [Solicola gregarius]UYM06538.1 hypothetical protein L0C25_05545 [Solicola gregarius]
MTDMEHVVDDLGSLSALRTRGTKATVERIRLDGRLADTASERALNRTYFSCGCEQGSVAVLLTMVGCVVGVLVHGPGAPFGWWQIGVYLAVSAVVGKAVGLFVARLLFRRIYRRLEADLKGA